MSEEEASELELPPLTDTNDVDTYDNRDGSRNDSFGDPSYGTALEPHSASLLSGVVEDALDDDDEYFENIELPTASQFALMKANERAEVARREVRRAAVTFDPDQLEVLAGPDILEIGSIDVAVIEEEENAAILAQKRMTEEESRIFQRRITGLRQKKKDAVRDSEARHRQILKDQQTKDATVMRRLKSQKKVLKNAFRKSKKLMLTTKKKRKEEVKETFGKLSVGDSKSSPLKKNVKFDSALQSTAVRILLCRSVRDKVPAGDYVVLLSLYDQLGGKPLSWTATAGKFAWAREMASDFRHCVSDSFHRCIRLINPAHRYRFSNEEQDADTSVHTFPEHFSGEHGDLEMKFNQNIFIICPARKDIRPSMVFIFELVVLPNEWVEEPTVVGWSIFPVCDMDLNITEGRFKTPVVRGPVRKDIISYREFQDIYSDDLDEWIGNLYFEVDRKPRISKGIREDEYKNAVSLEVLGNPDRSDESEGEDELAKDLERGMAGEDMEDLWGSDEDEMDDDLRELLSRHKGPVKSRPFTHAQLLEQHGFAVSKLEGHREHREMRRRLVYLFREFVSELGFRYLFTVEFWGGIFLLVIAFYLQMFAHSLSQLLWLLLFQVPVYAFWPTPFGVVLAFKHDEIDSFVLLGYIIIGPLATVILFLILQSLAALVYSLLRGFPQIAYRFILGMGFMALLNPLFANVGQLINWGILWLSWRYFPWDSLSTDVGARIIPIAQSMQLYSESQPALTLDCALLYEHFEHTVLSGYFGIALTFASYALITLFAFFLLHYYFLHTYRGGRIKDIYDRLRAMEGTFFVPRDNEVSLSEITWLCEKAERYRGSDGSRRKVAVFEYLLRDEKYENFSELTKHLAIFTLQVDNSRKLWRHFLRLPDGAVVELVDDINEMDSDVLNQINRNVGSSADAIDMFLEGHD
jgi:hypothetical protein